MLLTTYPHINPVQSSVHLRAHTVFLKQNSPQVAKELRLLKIPLQLSCFTKVWTQNETTLEMFLTFSFLSKLEARNSIQTTHLTP